MIEVVNRQRGQKVDEEEARTIAARALLEINKGAQAVTIAFISDRRMQELNRSFRGINRTTDVLSFPRSESFDDDSIGDIAISVEQARRQARENGLTVDQEVAQLILHGLLHLCGYDHETDDGEMNRLELRLRRRLGI